MTPFVSTLALVGVVIMVAALLSGFVERARFPQVALFLVLGAVLGPYGLGLVDTGLESPVLETISTISLILVLFMDAVGVTWRDLRGQARLAALVLGPGTLLAAALTGCAAWGLLGLPPALAVILGAALSSTDPVLMRGLLRREGVPTSARQALRLESGLNDIVLLPLVLVAMAIQSGATVGSSTGWGRLAVNLVVLGPGVGALVGFTGVALLEGIRRRTGVRRDYESIYALGVAFAAYAAAEAIHGSGLLAAFAAGLTVAAFDAELCDCFVDYGQATAEMFLLLTFVAFGSSSMWTAFDAVSWRSALFSLVALFGRTLALAVVLPRRGLDAKSRHLIVWYGPRGLSALLYVLLPIFAGVPGANALFPYAALVVLLSVVIHGGALMFIGPKPPARVAGAVPASVDSSGSGSAAATGERITLDELRALQARGEPVVLLDARKDGAWVESAVKAAGAIRIPPDDAALRAAELALPRNAWLVAYCA